MSKKKEIIDKTEPVFTKEQFIKSSSYRQYKDLLNAVLDDRKTYTKEQVNETINKYYKKGGK